MSQNALQAACVAKPTIVASAASPFVVYRKYESLDALKNLGEQVKDLAEEAMNDVRVQLKPDNGRLFLRVELEVKVEDVPIENHYEFKAEAFCQ